MNAGWQIKTIGDVCEVIAGQSPEGKFYNTDGNGLPFYQGKKEFTDKFIGGPTTWTTSVTKEANQGDILMSVRAPVGPVNFATQPICIGRGLTAIRAGGLVNKDFLFYFFLKHESGLVGNAGAVFDSINKTQIQAIPLLLPPLPEQQRIVTILDQAFEGIATATANAEKNLANARELFRSELQVMFIEQVNISNMVELSDLTSDITDGDHQPPPKASEGIPFITISNIDKIHRTINFTDTFKVPRSYFDGLKAHRRPKRGDVLYTVTGSFGIPVLVDSDVEFCFQRHIGLIRPLSHVDSKWLFYLMLSPQVFKQADDCATGAAQRTVSLKSLRSFSVPQPTLKDQQKVVSRLDEILTETLRLEIIYQQKLSALADLKKSLLHRAFSGQLH